MMTVPFTKRFTKEENGGLSVEAVLVFPLLIWAITATFVFFDAFKSLHVSQKATYAVADMMSRETEAIDRDYLTTMHELFAYLSKDETNTSSIRFTIVERGLDVDGNEETTMVCSEAVGGGDGGEVLPYANLNVLEDRIPAMMVGDQLIVVETEHEWAPAFAVGLASYRFREVTVARPRFSPQVVLGSCAGADPSTGGASSDGTLDGSDSSDAT